MYDIIIIGGGASGLSAGITACKRNKKVLIIEANERVGKKILATGNGKCNLANISVSKSNYNNDYVDINLDKYHKIFSLFDIIGLKYKLVSNRYYPYSESANTVVNLLRNAYQGDLITNTFVKSIEKTSKGYIVNGYECKNILLATGSNATSGKNSHHLYEKFGHKCTELRPSLVPLLTDVKYTKNLAGVRAKVRIDLFDNNICVKSSFGELLFKDNGLSGIVCFEISSYLARHNINGEVKIDFCPDMSSEEVAEFLIKNPLEGLLHRAISEAVIYKAKAEKSSIPVMVKGFSVKGVKNSQIKFAQVTSGGLEVSQFDENFMSKINKGLYASGEVMDIDGDCGGYNLSWAFLSGIIVGENI